MFKRLRWTLFGAMAGVGGSIWVRRRVRQMVSRYLPEQLASEARAWLAIAGDDLLAAIDEGRAAMHEREAELRARFADRMIAPPAQRGKIIDARPPPPHPVGATRVSRPDVPGAASRDRSAHPPPPNSH